MALTKISSALITPDAINGALIADDAIAAEHIADNAVDIARLNVSDGSSGQALTTNGSGTLSFSTIEGAYNGWSIKTGTYSAANKDQLIANSASAFTITLPSGTAGATVIICNAGAGTVTIARTSNQKINSVAEDGTLPQGNSVQLVFIDDANIGWFEV